MAEERFILISPAALEAPSFNPSLPFEYTFVAVTTLPFRYELPEETILLQAVDVEIAEPSPEPVENVML